MSLYTKCNPAVLPRAALLLLLIATLWSCAGKNETWIPEASLRIGVAGFVQPMASADLLAGYLPENIEKIDQKVFPLLNEDFAHLLAKTSKREFVGYADSWRCANKTPRAASMAAFGYWMQIGQCMGVDLLIVPQIQHWQERVGSDFGAETPAAVTMDIFLLDIRNKSLAARSRYDELQRPLMENLLELDKFIERGGKWVTAKQLAQEGMFKAIKEFGL